MDKNNHTLIKKFIAELVEMALNDSTIDIYITLGTKYRIETVTIGNTTIIRIVDLKRENSE